MRPRRWQRVSEAGVASANAGDFAAAEAAFREALTLSEQLPPSDPRRATSANNLGFVLLRPGAHPRGPALLRRRPVLARRHPGPDPSRHGAEPQQSGGGAAHRRAAGAGGAAASPCDRHPAHQARTRSSRPRREPEQSGRAADRRAAVRRGAGAVRRSPGDPHQGAGRAALGRSRGEEQSRRAGIRPRATMPKPNGAIATCWRPKRRSAARAIPRSPSR